MNNEAVCRLAPATMRKNLKRLNRTRKKVFLVFIKVDKGKKGGGVPECRFKKS